MLNHYDVNAFFVRFTAQEGPSQYLPCTATLWCAVMMLLLSGCGHGPPSTKTKSSQFTTLSEKVNYLQKYVAYRRNYETLDFDIYYQNNSGGMVPGPSESEIRLVATVPAAELNSWIPAGVARSESAPKDLSWLSSVPTSLDLSGVNEWYQQGTRTVGIDRPRNIVVYNKQSY